MSNSNPKPFLLGLILANAGAYGALGVYYLLVWLKIISLGYGPFNFGPTYIFIIIVMAIFILAIMNIIVISLYLFKVKSKSVGSIIWSIVGLVLSFIPVLLMLKIFGVEGIGVSLLFAVFGVFALMGGVY